MNRDGTRACIKPVKNVFVPHNFGGVAKRKRDSMDSPDPTIV